MRISSNKTVLLSGAMALLLFCGCASKNVTVTAASPQSVWQSFQSHYCRSFQEPAVLLKASLYSTRLTPQKRTSRTLLTLFGDFNGPLRLDIAAGIGKLVAHVKESKDGLFVYYPLEKKAYAHVDPVLGARRLGLPLPLPLAEIASIAMGNFTQLIPIRFTSVIRKNSGFEYFLDHSRTSSVTLDFNGRPIILVGRTSSGYDPVEWQLKLERYEGDDVLGLPRRLTLCMAGVQRGILHIQSRELRVAHWPSKAMTLSVPDETPVYRLDH